MAINLSKKFSQEIEDFQTKEITIVPGFFFNQYKNIQKIYFYYHSKFITGDIDDEGDRKYFFNIVRNPSKVFSKAIDFDTKNIRLLTAAGGDSLKTWFMERDLKFWMKKKRFGKILNRLFRELPIYGTVVLKIVDGTPMFVDLRNFVVEQSADSLDETNYMIEIHNYTISGFRKIAKKMGWSQVDEVIQEFGKMQGVSHIKVYERHGLIEDVDDKGISTFKRKRIILADVGVDTFDQKGNLDMQHPGIKLEEKEMDGHPYWEFHIDKIAGRWQGVGVVESLSEPQIRQNEIANLQAKGSSWAALRLFQSRDSTVARNLLTDARNGEVLTVDDKITPIDMSDRNLAFFNEETRKWMENRDELTFTFDGVQGQRAPASTPLGETRINVSQTLSYFEQIQEDVAMDIKELLYEVILPQFGKEMNDKHTLRLVGQDLDKYVELVKNEMVLKEIIRQMANGLPFPSNEEKDIIALGVEESIKQSQEKILEISSGFYKNLKYDIDIDITGESVDTRVKNATLFAILQAIQADPTMLVDPAKRKILFGIAEGGGINPNDLFDSMIKRPEELLPEGTAPKMGGGGVSAPQLGQSVGGQATQTI